VSSALHAELLSSFDFCIQELSQTSAKLADAKQQLASASELADRLQADAQDASQRHAAQLDSLNTELSDSKAQLQQHISACAEVRSLHRCNATAAFAAGMVLATPPACTRQVHAKLCAPAERLKKVQEKDAILTENRRLLEKAQRERETLMEQLSHAQRGSEQARNECKAAQAESEQQAAAVQRAEAAIDALEKEHNRFVKQASDLCSQKDAEIVVRSNTFPFPPAHFSRCIVQLVISASADAIAIAHRSSLQEAHSEVQQARSDAAAAQTAQLQRHAEELARQRLQRDAEAAELRCEADAVRAAEAVAGSAASEARGATAALQEQLSEAKAELADGRREARNATSQFCKREDHDRVACSSLH
jgi:hypothetical protein